MAQHDWHLKLEDSYGQLRCYRVLRHGDNCVSFYAAEEAS